MFHSRQVFLPTAAPSARTTLSKAVRRLASWPFRVAAARAAMRQLAGMSDHELADINLTRQDLRDASALPLSDDPTRIFAMRARERACR
jgi:uncharacterized protein YjiS (DUF1127 family)